jgi:hypothetical protein
VKVIPKEDSVAAMVFAKVMATPLIPVILGPDSVSATSGGDAPFFKVT